MDDAAWDAAVMGVVLRLSPSLVMEIDRGGLSLDTATEILQATTQGALTGTREFLTGCLSDVMDYRLDGTIPEAGEVDIPWEDPCPDATAEALSELAWSLAYAIEAGKLSLETAVLLYATAADMPKDEAEEVVTATMAERMTEELEYGD